MIHVNWSELNKALAGKDSIPACKKLKALLRIANPYVSDAIANLFMIEAVLRDKDFSVLMFYGLYRDHPSSRFKAPVLDRKYFKTNDDRTRITEPSLLQDYIDAVTKDVAEGKVLIAPGGPGDESLHIYVEAKERTDVQRLGGNILGEINLRYKNYTPLVFDEVLQPLDEEDEESNF